MKKILCFSLFACTFLLSAQEKLTRYQLNDEINYLVPASFVPMSKSERIQKVVSNREPLAMHTSMDGEVSLGVNYNRMQWKEGDEALLHDFYKASILSMFDKVTFIQDEVREINGKKFAVFEFIGLLQSENAFSSKSSESYSYIQYTLHNNQVLLFNFGCKKRLMNQWQSIAREIMESVKVKE